MNDFTLEQFKRRTSLRQIEILVVVRNSGSISNAAILLKVSAASVTRACQRFEQNIPFPVFQKKRKGVEFTEAGTALIGELEILYKAIDLFSRHSQMVFAPNSTAISNFASKPL